MTYSRNSLSQAVHYALGAGAIAGFTIGGPALAQDQDENVDLDRVQVTGSRLSQVDIEGATPVTVLDRTDIERIGLNDLADIIRQLPSITGSPLSTRTNNGGSGATLADIRGLGTNRTLVLVNGRRDIATGDLSTVPVSIVERIDVLKEGASAIYGADAVTGVINIITRQDFQGAEFIANYGRAFDLVDNPAAEEVNDPGLRGTDGDSKRVSFVFGSSGEKSNFVIGLEYNEQDPVFQGNVNSPQFQLSLAVSDLDDYLAGGLDAVNQDLDGDGVLGLVSVGSSRTLGGFFNTSQGLLTRDLQTGEIRPLNTCGDPIGCGGDLYNFAPVNFVQTPFERTNLFVQGDYDLFENVNAYVEARYSNRRSSQLLAPLPYDSRTNPGAPLPGGVTGVSADNVYNPFGEDLTDVRRRIAETGGRDFQQEVNQIQINTGLRGTFGDFAPTWNWDVSWQWGRRARVDTNFGQFVGSRLSLALGPSFFDASGNAVCGTPDNPIPGCVPLNLFGGNGTITQDQLNYVSASVNNRFTTKRQVFNATVDGDLIELPAGPVGVALGYETRKEEFSSLPDSSVATGAITGNAFAPTVGEYDVDSLFVETVIPLLSGVPGAELLELGGGFRYDDYSTIGSTGNFQASLRWQPIRGLLIRGSYSEVFREPNVGELFGGQADSFPSFQDVCSTGVLGNPNAPNLFAGLTPDQQARCVATGVPQGGFFQSDVQVRSRTGGNPNVDPESGETWTVGAAFSPDFLPGFSVTVDYWEVDLQDAITSIAAQNVVTECVINNDQNQCANITRFADGNVNAILATNTNIGGETARGVDIGLNYSTNTGFGLFDARLLATHLAERESTVLTSIDAAGTFDQRNGLPRGVYPEWRGTFNLDWTYGNFGASANIDYIGSVDEFNLGSGAFQQKVDAEWYLDLVARYNFSWGSQVSFGVTNVFDNDPPFIIQEFNANTDTDTYRLLGRSWFAEIRHNF
ncbi:MAG: TonB-dependent receptor [Wenzhouxiangellaceae bacterium]